MPHAEWPAPPAAGEAGASCPRIAASPAACGLPGDPALRGRRMILCMATVGCHVVRMEIEMRQSRLLVALVAALIGLVWIGQGSGIIAGSAMSGSPFWGVVGLLLVVVAVVIVVRERSFARK